MPSLLSCIISSQLMSGYLLFLLWLLAYLVTRVMGQWLPRCLTLVYLLATLILLYFTSWLHFVLRLLCYCNLRYLWLPCYSTRPPVYCADLPPGYRVPLMAFTFFPALFTSLHLLDNLSFWIARSRLSRCSRSVACLSAPSHPLHCCQLVPPLHSPLPPSAAA